MTYSESPGTVEDTSANPAEDQTFTGTVDNAPPTVLSIETASTTTINLILSEEITLNSTAPGDFVLSGDITTSPTVNAIAADGDTVTLSLSGMLDDDDDISLAYSKNTGSIDDTASPSFVDSFSVSSQESSPSGLAFSANGAKMFVTGDNGDDVNEYTLSAPFDVSTASFVDSFSVSSQDTSPRGLAFSANGEKMFVLGTIGDDVNEYTLSAPFDVSTASFVDSFSVSSQEANPLGLAFSANGEKMFVLGTLGDDVNEYTLSAPFDVSTASFVDSFSVASQNAFPAGLAFSANGDKMFVVDSSSDNVNEYTLSAPFDVSAASFAGSFSVASEDTSPRGLAFSADGEKMFVVGNDGDDVNEYTLAKPFTLLPNSLASFAAATVANNIAPPDATPPSIIAASVDSASTITITYSENVDVSTTDGQGFSLSTGDVSANSDPGGSSSIITLTVSGITTSDTPDVTYSASQGTVTGTSSNPAEDQTIGTTDNAPPTVLSIETASTTTINLMLSEEITVNSAAPEDFVLSGDITTSPTVNAITANNDIVTLSLSDSLDSDDDISLEYSKNTGSIDDTASPSFAGSFSVSSQESSPHGLAFSANGAKMFVVGTNSDNVNEYTLSTPFDVSSASYVDSLSVSSQDESPHGLAFSANGAKMFVVGAIGGNVNEYTLSTPFDVSAASFVDSFSVSSQDSDPSGLAFSANGAKMFVVGFNGDDVNEYTLTAPFDVSTASFVDSFSVTSQDLAPFGLAFSANGAKMFVVGYDDDDVNEYTLTTPFDVSTASFAGSFSVSSQETSPSGLAFSANGEKMFVLGDSGDDVNEYTLAKPFTLLPNSLASFTSDVQNIPTPAITITSPDDSYLTNNRVLDVTGTVTDATTVSITIDGGTAISVDAVNGEWSQTVTLAEGENTIRVFTSDASESITVTLDTIAPVITQSPGRVLYVEWKSDYSKIGGATTDDGSEITTTSDTLSDSSPPGRYFITYTAVDLAGNAATPVVDRLIVVRDTTAPIITLIGAAQLDVQRTITYSDPGAEVIDNDDPSHDYTVSNNLDFLPIDTSRLGTHTITYTSNSDVSGNSPDPVTRTVNIIPHTDDIPVILSPSDGEVFEYNVLPISGTYRPDSSVLLILGENTRHMIDTDAQGDWSTSLVPTSTTVPITVYPYFNGEYQTDDDDGLSASVTVTVGRDAPPLPTITITSPADGHITTDSVLAVEGTVTDATSVSITIDDGTPISVAASNEAWSHTVNLDEGSNTIRVSASNTFSDEIVSESITVTLDTTPPVITLNGADSITLGLGNDYTELGALTNDGSPVTIDSSAVTTSVRGTYQVYYNSVDSAGNAADQISRTVVIIDPTITITSPADGHITTDSVLAVEGTVTDATSVSITIDGGPAISVAASNGAWSHTVNLAEGSNTIRVFTSETNSVSITVTLDTTPPVITLTGANPQTIGLGDDAYAELGATTDDGSDVTIDSSNVNTSAIGTYQVLYNSVDSADNAAAQVIRTVTVVDTTPVITITSPADQSYTNSNTLGVEGTVTHVTSVTITVNGANPITASTANGVWSQAVNLVDELNTIRVFTSDTNSESITVTLDTVVPVITLNGADSVELEFGDAYTELGATTDDGSPVAINSSEVDTSAVGTYQVFYDSVDSADNAAVRVIRTVTISDTIPPIITLNGDAEVNVQRTSTYSDPGATVTDDDDPTRTYLVTANPQTLDTSVLGSYTIEYTSTADRSGNAPALVTRTVNIIPHTLDTPVITSPVSGDVVGAGQITVSGTYRPNSSVQLTDGRTIVESDTDAQGAWSAQLPATNIAEDNTLTITVYPHFNNKYQILNDISASVTVGIETTIPPPVITITSPSDQYITSNNVLVVTGTVDGADSLTVSHNGFAHHVIPANGEWSWSLTLVEGPNTIRVPTSDTNSESITVTLDTTPPTVVSIGTASPTTIDLVLSEEITDNSAAPGDFVLSGDITTTPTVTTITANGDTVTLTLSGTLDSDDVISLAYTKSTGSIDDAASPQPNSLASFAATPVVDGTPPTVLSIGTASPTTIDLVLSEDITVNSADPGDFVLSGDITTTPTVTTITANDNIVTLTLSGTLDDDDVISLAYAKTTGSIDDAASNSLASFAAISVTNNIAPPDVTPPEVDNTPPTVVSIGTASPTTIDLVLSEEITVNSAAPGDFELTGDITTTPTVTTITANGATVTLTLSGSLDDDDVISLAYAKTTGSIDDAASNSLASFAATPVTNNIAPPDVTPPEVDNTPPTVLSIGTASPTTIDLVLSEDITVNSAAPGDFELTGDITTTPTVNAIAANDNIVTLSLSGSLDDDDVISLAYTKTTGSIDDAASPPNSLASFAATPVANNIAPPDVTPPEVDNTPPTVVSIGTASPTTIDLVLSEEITVNSAAPGDFELTGDITTTPTVNAVTANGATVTLTLSGSLDDDDVISLAYTKTTGSIDDAASPPNSLASFAAVTVTNNIAPTDTPAPPTDGLLPLPECADLDIGSCIPIGLSASHSSATSGDVVEYTMIFRNGIDIDAYNIESYDIRWVVTNIRGEDNPLRSSSIIPSEDGRSATLTIPTSETLASTTVRITAFIDGPGGHPVTTNPDELLDIIFLNSEGQQPLVNPTVRLSLFSPIAAELAFTINDLTSPESSISDSVSHLGVDADGIGTQFSDTIQLVAGHQYSVDVSYSDAAKPLREEPTIHCIISGVTVAMPVTLESGNDLRCIYTLVITPSPTTPPAGSRGGGGGGGGSSSSGDRSPPSFTTSFEEGANTILINGIGIAPAPFKIDQVLSSPILVSAGEPTPFSLTLYENTSWEGITHIEICLNKQVSNRDATCHSATKIIWDKNSPDDELEIIDPNGLIHNATIGITEVKASVATFDFDVTFGGAMDTSDIQLYIWDATRNSLVFTIYNALSVTEGAAPASNTENVKLPCDAGELVLDDGTCMDPEPGTFACPDGQVMRYDGACIAAADPQDATSDAGYDDASYDDVIMSWAGYSPESATDSQLMSALDIASDPDVSLPKWVKKYLGEWAYKDKISTEQLRIVLSYLAGISR